MTTHCEASSLRSNASYWSGAGSRRRPRHGPRSSISSRASTIRVVAIRRSAISHRSITSAVMRASRHAQPAIVLAAVKDKPSGRPQRGAVLDRRCATAAHSRGPGRKNGSAGGRTKESSQGGQHALRSDTLISSAHLSTKPGKSRHCLAGAQPILGICVSARNVTDYLPLLPDGAIPVSMPEYGPACAGLVRGGTAGRPGHVRVRHLPCMRATSLC